MSKNKTSSAGVIITIVLLIVIVILSNIKTNKISQVGNAITNIFMPIQNGFVFVKNKITNNDQEISDISKLKDENSQLKEQNQKLLEEERELEIIKTENNTLKQYLKKKKKYSNYSTIPAYVVERSYSNYEKVVVINVGKSDGIEVNMPVISESGLVGHVIDITENTAKVQTLIDTANTVSANISTTDDGILAKGQLGSNNEIKATNIPAEATILQGDTVITSGLGGIYPKGILVGTIKEVVNTKNQTDRYAKITPATDFNKLSTVLVITNK